MEPHDTLTKALPFRDVDHRAWWDKAGRMFLKAMQHAGYDTAAQYHNLEFLQRHVLPYCHVYPSLENEEKRWKSFLCPYGQPWEPSLNITEGIVRFAMEPVGPDAGTAKDPLNTNIIWEFLNGIKQWDDRVDFTWFRRFQARLMPTEEETERYVAGGDYGVKPGLGPYGGVAIDLKGTQPMVKGYFTVNLKSVLSGIPAGKLMFDTVRDVDIDGRVATPLKIVEDYAAESANTLSLTFTSLDLVKPEDARIKIYGLDAEVTWDRLESLWTLGGRVNNETSREGLRLLRELWDLLKIPPGVRSGNVDHLKIGEPPRYMLPTIVNWTLLPGREDPLPQIYLVPFSMQDEHIADALSAFFERNGLMELAGNYKKNMASYFPDEDLAKTFHHQQAISFSYRKGKPYLSAYVSLI